MKTNHKIVFENSSNLGRLDPESVNLVLTSPPYPMIEMWDELFSSLNPQIKSALENHEGMKAYELMNEELNKVWKEVDKLMAYGGIVAINIGDATRKIGNSFQLYANHSRITHYFEKMGYQVLPLIIWRKETNKPNKFMGSGMLPPNAYVTLEHEYILIFRKGGNRKFDNNEKENRRKSTYFWEERNVWFSDVWSDLKGISQKINHKKIRERTAAFPFELAYRIINMYSVQNDLVLDPFLGTGTTTIAAICSGRNSIGCELDPNFKEIIESRINETVKFSKELVMQRLKNHQKFVEEREREKGQLKHVSNNYNFKVVTNQEKLMSFPILKKVINVGNNLFECDYEYIKNLQDTECSKKEMQKKLI